MKQSNLSIFNSKSSASSIAVIFKIVMLTCLFLAALDIGINFLFKMPSSPLTEPSKMQQYFNYGRSTESKLRYMVRETDETSAPIALSGWISEKVNLPVKAEQPNRRLIAIYGQSMSERIGSQAEIQDEAVTVRFRGGPAAPLGHSYALFISDQNEHQADVVVLGIVASGIQLLETMTTMGWAFEHPFPYTYPRWRLVDGKLTPIYPLIDSLGSLRNALNDHEQWTLFRDQLRAHDVSYSPWLFEAGLSDYSAFLSMLRRGYGQSHQDTLSATYGVSSSGDKSPTAAITQAIVSQFASDVRAKGAIPVLLLLHDRGTGNELFTLLSDVINRNNILYVSTHDIAPANDASSFLKDGHFKLEYDVVFAQKLLERLP